MSPAPVPNNEDRPVGRWTALAVLALATFLGMSCWFSASAVLPQLRAEWELSSRVAAWLTIAVQLGFVTGALLSAVLNLPDVHSPRRMMLAGACLTAAANGLLVVAGGVGAALALRFVSGMGLALVYPPSLKVVSTWFRKERGLALGVMIGALTLGSALPHLLNAFAPFPWRGLILATSALTALGGAVAEWAGRDGPFPFPRATFDPRQVVRCLQNPGVRLASLGYFGHMWELYAMWSWCAAFYADVLARSGVEPAARRASLAAFAVVGIGALGCVAAGQWADRWGRARIAGLAMAVSGACALGIGWTMSYPALALTVGLAWGFWVVADSAQFSALVTEAADQQYVGTALTTQLAIGFTLTVVTIWLVPVVREAAGWPLALGMLAPGPALGVLAMLRLSARLEGTPLRTAKPDTEGR